MKPDRAKSIYYAVDSWWGCAWYRAHVPGVELSRRGYNVAMDTGFPLGTLQGFDVVVFQRPKTPEALRAIELANAMGKTTVFELDDDLWHVDEENPAYRTWSNRQHRHLLEQCARRCTLVTTTTDVLADVLREFNPDVRVLPNMLPREQWQLRRKPNAGRLVVGWAGSMARAADLELIRPALMEVLDACTHVELWVTGEDNVKAFPQHKRIKLVQTVRIEALAQLIAPFDIGLAPLRDTAFNRAKSDLKFLEYGALGIPTVATRLDPYANTIEHGISGFLADTEGEWLESLRTLIEDRELRRRVGEAARTFTQMRMIEKNIQLWEAAYGLCPDTTGRIEGTRR